MKRKRKNVNRSQRKKEIYNKCEKVEQVGEFHYLGSILTKKGGTETDIKDRMKKKTKQTFGTLKSIFISTKVSVNTKIRIFNCNVNPVLLYWCETWSAIGNTLNRIQKFMNKCLRCTVKIFWPNTISNKNLLQRTKQVSILPEIKKGKCRWIKHTLWKKKPKDGIALWKPFTLLLSEMDLIIIKWDKFSR